MIANESSYSPRQRTTLDAVIKIMAEIHRHDITVYNESFLAKTLEKRLLATACKASAAYLKCLSEEGAEADTFNRSLLVVYSEFFRKPLTFALLELQLLPNLAYGFDGYISKPIDADLFHQTVSEVLNGNA